MQIRLLPRLFDGADRPGRTRTPSWPLPEALGIELEEIDDWNCCGATEYIALEQTAAYALIGRNLALAARQDGLEAARGALQRVLPQPAQDRPLHGQVPEAGQDNQCAWRPAGCTTSRARWQVRHLLDVIVNDVGLEAIRAR